MRMADGTIHIVRGAMLVSDYEHSEGLMVLMME